MADIPLEYYCQLLPADKSRPTIDLSDDTALILGRSPLTLITDRKVSRNQLEVTANFAKQELLVRQLGANPSLAAGTILKKNDTHLLGPMASLELLEGQYKYFVHFGKKVSKDILEKLKSSDNDGDIKGKEENSDIVENEPREMPPQEPSRKRLHSPSNEEDIAIAPKKPKILRQTSTSPPLATRASTRRAPKTTNQKSKQSSLATFFTDNKRGEDKVITSQWKEVETILILQFGEAVHSTKLACFDLDGTLIETASGRKFATGPTDWKLLPKVRPKLQSLTEEGFKIVIFTNQLGISKGKPTKDEFKQKMTSIATSLQVPVLVIAATRKDKFRKPAPGGWEHLVDMENGGIMVDKRESFFVGDAAGREAGWKQGAKKDFSCGDRQFASNLSLNFYTPEEFFHDLPKSKKFSWGGFVPSSLDYTKTTPTLTPPTAKITSDSQEVIILVGCPASGKSSFYMNHLSSRGYAHINRDKMGSWQKCVQECKQQLAAGKSVAIDNTSPDKESRKRYIDCARDYKVPTRCLQFMTTIAHAKHNNRYREITQKDSAYIKVNDLAFNMYKSKFCEPSISEGFAEIVKVEIAPVFRDKKKEELYRMFLVDK